MENESNLLRPLVNLYESKWEELAINYKNGKISKEDFKSSIEKIKKALLTSITKFHLRFYLFLRFEQVDEKMNREYGIFKYKFPFYRGYGI